MICVKPGDNPSHWRKAEEVLSVVDSDLGFSEVGIRWPDRTKVRRYFYTFILKVTLFYQGVHVRG